MRRFLLPLLLPLLVAATAAQTPIVTHAGENMHLRSATVTAAGAQWNVTLVMEDDNTNAALGSTFRRWWHCQIGNLNPAGVTLHVSVTNAGYNDVILPVWALSTNGTAFGSYNRCPVSATPTVSGGGTTHTFTLVVPPGVIAIRLAKYFPYTVTRKDAFVASLAGHPRVRSITTIGSSVQGRSIERIEFTDGTLPDAGKVRVWIHTAVHPAETTAYFTMEGLVAWLLSGDPWAEVLLDHALIDLVPMANPDGVFLGNYRVNANSANLENEWVAPYNSSQPEIVAMRTAIEGYMGTVASPGSNPIRVLLNLHSSHNVNYPFLFRHTANASWNPTTNNSGVIPIVNAIEGQWIALFKARSPFVNLGSTQSSTAGAPSRPFVESMMHDRWTAVNGWLNAPGVQEPVMAITFEGTYGVGPDTVTWNTEADYRLCGAQLGRALCDYFGLQLQASALSYGAPCASVQLAGSLAQQPDGSHLANLLVSAGPANGFAFLVAGGTQLAVPLPAPWSSCLLLASPDATAGFLLDGGG
ncbi:MAG TPA: M14 family zinc carboxypeptidase, partial [Planctomycetota bacterium]|nr:M14 family zinc carboxypeptidase [Planctomycetota bacterium]